MFGLLNTTQIYGVQTATHKNNNNEPTTSKILNNLSTTNTTSSRHSNNPSNNKHHQHQRPRSVSSLSDSVRESKIFSSLSSMHAGFKTPTNLIEKFLKSEFLNNYENLKNYKNFQNSTQGTTTSSTSTTTIHSNNINNNTNHRNSYTEGLLNNFNCLQGSYRNNSDGEFYEAINVVNNTRTSEMTIKCSKNLLAEPPQVQAPATLQNYQKLPDYEQHGGYIATPEVLQMPSSGASSGEFNNDLNNQQQQQSTATITTTMPATSSSTSSSNSFYKRLSFGGNRSNNSSSKHLDVIAQSQANESASDNSSSSITTTTTTNSSTSTTTTKSNDLHRSSSASSSGDCVTMTTTRERKCKSLNSQDLMMTTNNNNNNNSNNNTINQINVNATLTPERMQRRKLIQMISNYEQQNKQLQRELIKEKRRRTEELSRVVKSLFCFESKLKTDMKAVNQRLAEKDNEICRLVRQNRALRKKLAEVKDKICDEGVVVGDGDVDGDGEADDVNSDNDKDAIKNQKELMELDCLVLEALQCQNCRKQFYDIELNESCTQTMMGKDGSRKNADHNMEHGSSSDDTVSSSFCGARRSVRYTSKRTSGTFRDYMRSRAMNIDDPALEQNSEENTSTISRDDSQTSYEKLNLYSRSIERMHGVKCEMEREFSERSNNSLKGSSSRSSSRCSSKSSEKSTAAVVAAMEEDDGIFSPTQDDDFEEEQQSDPTSTSNRALKIVSSRRITEFSEASPKQIYETSTDDWYASASDQEEIIVAGNKTSYGQGAVNPVLECVNQILLQQSMDETVVLREKSSTPKRPKNLPLLTTTTTMTTSTATTTNLPRRSSLSGRRNSRNDNNTDPNSPRNPNITRKRVHFSTKNSMVHVPRNDEVDEENENDDNENDEDKGLQMKLLTPSISLSSTNYHPMHSLIVTPPNNVIATDVAVETFNYESIYSNEYEPVGSERNSSNLYVDMESAIKASKNKPPALPPKPANLIKFKKTTNLQQLDEVPDEQQQQQDCDANDTISTIASEPDYCSISEVNVGITNVQIVAVVHKAPESIITNNDDDNNDNDENDNETISEHDLEVSTVASDETCGAISQKTDEIEEIFADIPKLPNVAAIIAPKKQMKQLEQQQQQQKANNDYLIMSPKVETSNTKAQNARRLALNLNTSHELLSTPLKSPKIETTTFPIQLTTGGTPQQQQQQQHQQYKRKQIPNILAEINQRLSLPNTPTTPTASKAATNLSNKLKSSSIGNSIQQQPQQQQFDVANDLPIQAEFDWYNLDVEYGRSSTSSGSSHNQPDLLKVNDHLNGVGKLAEIQEDHESVTAAADEYNLDEEFSLSSDPPQPDVLSSSSQENQETEQPKSSSDSTSNSNSNLNIDFPLYNENSPAAPGKAKKMKKNLANFEKFIEGSGLSTKPLPSKRKIYFAGPYV